VTVTIDFVSTQYLCYDILVPLRLMDNSVNGYAVTPILLSLVGRQSLSIVYLITRAVGVCIE